MAATSEANYCNHCPRKNYGVCSGVLKILKQTTHFAFPKPFSVAAKQFVYHQGETPVRSYILREGWVLLTKVSDMGKRQVIQSVLPGDMFGFMTDISKPFAYSAIALQDSVVCSIPDLFKMCSQHPDLSLKMMWEEERKKALTEHYMGHIVHHNADEKIAFMVLELYQRLKLRGLNNGYCIPFPFNQEDIADTLGLTPVHINRTLHKLQKENLLSLHKHTLSILDYKKLVKIVGMDSGRFETSEVQNIV